MSTTFNTGTLSTPAKFSQREDLANFISNIVRDDIPFTSSIGKGKASAVNHEWNTDTLARPETQSVSEGADYSAPSTTPDVQRLGNYTQIFNKRINVTGTIESVDKAGRKSEFKYQSEKRGKELYRDIEFTLVGSRAVKAGGLTRAFGGYQSWVPQTNTIIGAQVTPFTQATSAKTVANGSSPVITGLLGDGTNVFSQGVIADLQYVTGSSGTTEALVETNTPSLLIGSPFSLSMVDDVMQAVWQNGGKPNTLMMSPKNKRAFSTAAQGLNSNVRRNIDEKGSLRQSVEMYESDFGMVKVIPNYIMAASSVGTGAALAHTDTDILAYDASSFKLATLRPLHHRDIAESGDSLRAMMVEEITLECMNPNAVGLITSVA